MLESKNVNLRVMEKEDLPLFAEWANKTEVLGEYNPLEQMSRTEAEKIFESSLEVKPFFIQKKDGSRIGCIWHFTNPLPRQLEIGYFLVPSERRKSYCSEALKIMVDYLFLSKNIFRIQAHVDVRNAASQKVLENAGLQREGTMRKCVFNRGEWRDYYLYSILREEWKEPRVLTKTK